MYDELELDTLGDKIFSEKSKGKDDYPKTALFLIMSDTDPTFILMAKAVVLVLGTETLYFVEPAAWIGALIFIMIPYYHYQRKLLS